MNLDTARVISSRNEASIAVGPSPTAACFASAVSIRASTRACFRKS